MLRNETYYLSYGFYIYTFQQMIKIITLFILSLFVSLGQFSSAVEQDADSFTKEQLADVQKLIDEIGEEEWKAIDAAALYKTNCAMCHGRKGGLGLGGAANLKESKLDNTHKFAMAYFGKGTMKSYKDVLSSAEILSLSHFLTTLKK